MLISHKHRFIALKTVKTAGTSTEMFFQPACLPVDMEVGEWTPAIATDQGVVGRRGPPPEDRATEIWINHMSAQKLKENTAPDVWENYLKFTNVRNPFSRILSGFYFSFKQRKLTPPDNWSETIESFDKFVHADRHSFMNMLFVDGQFAPDALIYFEALTDDIQQIATHVGFDRDIGDLPHSKKALNKPDGPKVADYFNTARADRIRRLDARAFEIAGYSDDPTDAYMRPENPAFMQQSLAQQPQGVH